MRLIPPNIVDQIWYLLANNFWLSENVETDIDGPIDTIYLKLGLSEPSSL